MPVKVGDRVRYNIISWCLEARQVEATPANGCAHWGAADAGARGAVVVRAGFIAGLKGD
jgi:hypothetical protein